MSDEGQRKLKRQTTRCGSFWMLYNFFCSQNYVDAFCSQNYVDAFSHRGSSTCRATHFRDSTRIPSRLLVKGGNEKEIVTPSKQKKSPTVKLLEEEKRKGTRKQINRVPLYQSEYLDHEILTADEEKVLGRKIRKAMSLRDEIRGIIEEKEAMEFERFMKQEEYARLLVEDGFFDFGMGSEGEEDFSSLFAHGLDGSIVEETRRQKNQFTSNIEIQPVDEYLDDLWVKKTIMESNTSSGGDPRRNLLSDDDLNRLGGRETISQILVDGAIAREKLISSNIRLVLSVAKKWCKNSMKSSGSSNDFAVIYGGSWTRPSLEEAVQEGIIGLATAADRFDPKRNLRFSTYATFWIVNYVRRCFQEASTGFRVPLYYHLVKQKYEQAVMSHYRETGGASMPMGEAANALGLSADRLRFVMKSTEPVISLDAPIPEGAKDGGDATVGDFISCTDPTPGDLVEVSLLRQCLENAMSSELSPHERDVVRLRYGLDDGTTRSVKETSKRLRVTASQVRHAENTAFRKLRSPHSVHTYSLFGYLDYI